MEQLFSFQGRTSRAGFWRAQRQFMLGSSAVVCLLILTTMADLPRWLAASGFIAMIVGWTWVLAALMVRRLHDLGRSAWWIAVFYGVPAILIGIGIAPIWVDLGRLAPVIGEYGWIMFGAALVLNTWGNIETGWLEGADSDNRFGPTPV